MAAALAELAAAYDEVPRRDGGLREKLDALAEDGMLHVLFEETVADDLIRDLSGNCG